MSTYESAKNQDPSLYLACFGGPRDGFRTGDLPAALSGQKLTGMSLSLRLGEPIHFSLTALYLCTSETQIEGFWRFDFVEMLGPDGEHLVAKAPAVVTVRDAEV